MEYYEGVGRRKTSTARVRLMKGDKVSTINQKPVEEYLTSKDDVNSVYEPLRTIGLEGQYYFTAVVSGGGTTGQTGAVQLGLTRALLDLDITYKPELRKKGLVTRDPRMVERKKYNHVKARKKPQFSKR